MNLPPDMIYVKIFLIITVSTGISFYETYRNFIGPVRQVFTLYHGDGKKYRIGERFLADTARPPIVFEIRDSF